MSKTAQIMALHRKGHTTREIACEVYQLPLATPRDALDPKMAYVRTVIRQRRQGDTPANLRWRAENREHYLAQKRGYWHSRKKEVDRPARVA